MFEFLRSEMPIPLVAVLHLKLYPIFWCILGAPGPRACSLLLLGAGWDLEQRVCSTQAAAAESPPGTVPPPSLLPVLPSLEQHTTNQRQANCKPPP